MHLVSDNVCSQKSGFKYSFIPFFFFFYHQTHKEEAVNMPPVEEVLSL